ncbi:hypothetical protein ACFGVR_15080 [Mucilaginibacter sp. AW1-3]
MVGAGIGLRFKRREWPLVSRLSVIWSFLCLLISGCTGNQSGQRTALVSGYRVIYAGKYKCVANLKGESRFLAVNLSHKGLLEMDIATGKKRMLPGCQDSAMINFTELNDKYIISGTAKGIKVWDKYNRQMAPQLLLSNNNIVSVVNSKTAGVIFITCENPSGKTALYRVNLNAGLQKMVTLLTDDVSKFQENQDGTGIIAWKWAGTKLTYIDQSTLTVSESSVLPYPIIEVYPLMGKAAIIHLSNGFSKRGGLEFGKIATYYFTSRKLTQLSEVRFQQLTVPEDRGSIWAVPLQWASKDFKGVHHFQKDSNSFVLDSIYLKKDLVDEVRIPGSNSRTWVEPNPFYSTSKGIHAFSRAGRTTKDHLYFKDQEVYRTEFNARGDIAWIIPSGGKGVLIANDRLNKAFTVLEDIRFESTFNEDGLDFVWGASPQKKAIFRVAGDGSAFNNGQPVIPNIDQDMEDPFIDLLRIDPEDLAITLWREDEGPSVSVSIPGRPEAKNSYQQLFIYNEPKRLNGAILSFEHAVFKSDKKISKEIRTMLPRGPFTANYELHFPFDKVGGSIEVTLRDKKGKLAASGSTTTRDSVGVVGIQPVNNGLKLNTAYDVSFRYRDANGSNLLIQWPETVFTQPWWMVPATVTVFAWALITILFVTLLYLPETFAGRKWYPLIPYLLGGTGLNLPFIAEKIHLDQSLFVFLLAFDLVMFLLLGMFSPAVFRRLSSSAGIGWLLKNLLLLPYFRRRIYADYLTASQTKIRRARQSANNEVYIQLPALYEGPSDGQQELNSPVTFIAEKFRTGNAPLLMLVKAPGGRGKSALLREIYSQMLADYLSASSKYIPVFCEGQGATIKEIIAQSMGEFLASEELLDWHLALGHFIILCDGFGGAEMAGDVLRKFQNDTSGSQTSLLISSRTGSDMEEVIRAAANWMVVEPKRLDDTTVNQFEEGYLRYDQERTQAPVFSLRPELKAVCKSPDGTFLPILIRLALIAQENGPVSIDGIYEWSIRQRIRSNFPDRTQEEKLFWSTVDVGYHNYWANQNTRGNREIFFNADNAETLADLLKCGIAIPGEEQQSGFDNPARKVRLFHDSLQTYLTARALLSRNDWDALFAAAGDPVFNSDRSDVVLGTGSELFQMCLLVFPAAELRARLINDIKQQGSLYSANLTMSEIISTIPETITSLKINDLKELSVLNAILDVLDRCAAADQSIQSVAAMYSKLSQLIWSKRLNSIS